MGTSMTPGGMGKNDESAKLKAARYQGACLWPAHCNAFEYSVPNNASDLF
ncbi:MAG TPA: hypothetical protein VKA13_04880 [Gammaproteobacteria bacterium]|nr:hypothetical protein [Gammaproteobacteria bacterium]